MSITSIISQKRIIFLGMIKNEEKIIKRCIESILNICDAICITDTGSTDTTIEILTQYFKELKIPAKLYHNEWKDFGQSRTQSYKNCVEMCKELKWSGDDTYGLLLDADMKLIVKNFSKNTLIKNGYTLIQENPCIKYHNVRLIRLNGEWTCVSKTHEYWSGNDIGHISYENMYINDIGDGGSKADKYTRDAKLLEEGIKEEPTNVRYHFYLGQTYRDLKEYKKAIEFYTKRIELGGWHEEIFQSYYSIGKCYLNLGDLYACEMWMQKAHKFRPSRPESIYFLCKMYREIGNYYKSMHY